MCGLAGIITNKSEHGDSIILVNNMIQYMQHRGPDDHDVVACGDCVLGQSRLSIRDVSINGRQPFTSSNGKVTVAVNGEIYNYKDLRRELEKLGYQFKSNSDSEVVLHGYIEWGSKLPEYLKGMFAFAVYDDENKSLYLCRDRQGIKPLYYSLVNGGIIFSSELGALLSSGLIKKKIDMHGLQQYLLFGYVPQTTSIISNVKSLLPGTVLQFKSGNCEIWHYWSPPSINNELNHNDIVPETRKLLNKSIVSHLQSDVPLGVFLSGGIDSTAVVGLCKKNTNHNISTFSIGFEDGPGKLNELSQAREISNWFGTQHHEFIVNGRYVLDNLSNFIQHMDVPTFDGINTYIVSGKVKQSGITVALSGLGGDELFGGYGIFKHYPTWIKYLKYWNFVPVHLKKMLITILRNFISSPIRKSKFTRLLSVNNPLSLYLMIRANGDIAAGESTIFKFNDNKYTQDLYSSLNDDASGINAWKLLQKYEMKNYMTWRLLRDTDAMSMAHSLEVRVPLIDDDIVDHVLSLPNGWEKTLGWPKKLLTESLKDILPDFVLNRQKQGFQLPMNIWMQNELLSVVEDVFSDKSIKDRGLFETKEMKDLYASFKRGSIPYEIIWKFVTLELWMRNHKVSI